jgi:hypothetical protein
VGVVKGFRAGIGRRVLVAGALVMVGVLVLVAGGDDSWMIGLSVLALLAGAAGAVVGPAHPLRNGALAGLIPLAVLVVGIPVQMLLGTFELAEGETTGSFLLELPFWLGFIGVPAALLGLLGGSVVSLARQASQRMHPR